MTDFAQLERAALADLLELVGPDAGTLCAGWTTRDLAAHLTVRQSRPDAAAGIVIKALAGHTRRVQDRVATRRWPELVAGVRRRPWWSAMADDAVNRVEYFIHHEDVRRAQPGWRPRELPRDFAAALWARVRPLARLVLRRTPAAVRVTAPELGSVGAGRGGPRVDLAGPPGELLLFLSGRQEHALVELTGPEAITGRMRRARYGI